MTWYDTITLGLSTLASSEYLLFSGFKNWKMVCYMTIQKTENFSDKSRSSLFLFILRWLQRINWPFLSAWWRCLFLLNFALLSCWVEWFWVAFTRRWRKVSIQFYAIILQWYLPFHRISTKKSLSLRLHALHCRTAWFNISQCYSKLAKIVVSYVS